MTAAAAATHIGSNSWLLEINDLRKLVDPWLVVTPVPEEPVMLSTAQG